MSDRTQLHINHLVIAPGVVDPITADEWHGEAWIDAEELLGLIDIHADIQVTFRAQDAAHTYEVVGVGYAGDPGDGVKSIKLQRVA
jgi:hypothetical protein